MAELRSKGELALSTRLSLARKAYARTSLYDGEIATELERLAANDDVVIGAREKLPQRIHISLERKQTMRYGENPHQQAALYIPAGRPAAGLAGAKQLQGKELSYNNLVDLDAAWNLVIEFSRPAVAIIKHNNPCGAAEQESLLDAYRKALACDPVSAFGGVLAFNRVLDAAAAEEVAKLFFECIVAPGYEEAALQNFASKKNLRLLEMPREAAVEDLELKRISGGVLVQETDRHQLAESDLRVVTERAPTQAELRSLLFGWKVCKHVKSNAIVFAREGCTVGIGAGQMSRVDSVKIAVIKAATAGLSLAGSAVASDAFFLSRTAWKKPERPVRRQLFSREALFAMLTWSLPPTSWTWLWFFPVCATSGTRFFHRRFLPMIGNFHHLHFAALRYDFGARQVSVCIQPRETGALGHSVCRILKLDLQSV